MDLGLKDKRAVVAASSAGLGLASARSLAQAGARVVISGRDRERLSSAVDQLSADGLDVVGIKADVSSPEGSAALVEQSTEQLGGVDILIANAGGAPPGTFATTSIDAYRDALDLNLLSTIATAFRRSSSGVPDRLPTQPAGPPSTAGSGSFQTT